MQWFFIMFGVGLGFIVISFFLDFITDTGPLAILQPKLIAIFLTVAGGVGLILRSDSLLAFGLSALAGVIVAAIINKLIIIPLAKAQNTSAFDQQATIGITAKVISPIAAGGYGKISYSISGSTVTSPAKSRDGSAIGAGEKVSIAYIEGGTYFVGQDLSN